MRRLAPLLLLLSPSLSDRAPPFHHARYDDLVALLAENPSTKRPVQSVEELMPLLPKELRANFTLVHASRSPFAASAKFDHPRLILFSEDARLVVALSGDRDKPGYDTLETIHFDDEAAAFRMSRFILPAAVARDPSLAEAAQKNGAQNPDECLHCHGDDPRPIFDAYPLWPGFYGSVLDTFPDGDPALPRYREFLAREKNSSTGIYRFLKWPKGTTVPPFLDPSKYDPHAEQAGADDLDVLPNARLGMALTELNRERIHRKLRGSPDYLRMRYALLSGLLDCTRLPVSVEKLLAIRAKVKAEHADALARLGFSPSPDPSEFVLAFATASAQIDYLSRAVGVSRRDWAMSFDDDSLAFYDGILSGIADKRNFYLKEDFALEILRDIIASDEKLRPYYRTYRAFPGVAFGERLDLVRARGACDTLRERVGRDKITLPKD